MHTIENFQNSHETIINDPFDGFVISASLKQLTTKLIHLETELQEINEHYRIVFQPHTTTKYDGYQYDLNIQLLYNDKEICSQNTFYSFLLYGSDREYTNAQFSNKNRGISAEVTFTKKPKLYCDLITNDFIKAFLANEKTLAQENFSKKLNTQLRSDNVFKVKF